MLAVVLVLVLVVEATRSRPSRDVAERFKKPSTCQENSRTDVSLSDDHFSDPLARIPTTVPQRLELVF